MKISGNMEIPNITVNLSEEDRARIDTIINLLQGAGPTVVTNVSPVMAPNPQEIAEAVAPLKPFPTETAPVSAQPTQEQPKQAEPNEVPPTPVKAESAPNTSAPEVTAADLQSKVVQLVSNGKKEETRAIIMAYAPRVGEIPAEKRAEVLEKLNALEG